VKSAAAASGVDRVTHRVKRGETLFSIARLYQTTVSALKQWNRISGSAIKIGQRLTILRGGATN
jgi:membrane-bound lytic murein transglycosylase D